MPPTTIPSPTACPNPDERAGTAPPEAESSERGAPLWSKVPDPVDSELEKVLHDYLRGRSFAA